MSHHARFEVVRSDAGWFARFRAADGSELWQTKLCWGRLRAEEAVEAIAFSAIIEHDGRTWVDITDVGYIEVRDIDERTATAS